MSTLIAIGAAIAVFTGVLEQVLVSDMLQERL